MYGNLFPFPVYVYFSTELRAAGKVTRVSSINIHSNIIENFCMNLFCIFCQNTKR